MKRTTQPIILILLTLILTACGAAAGTSSGSAPMDELSAGALPPQLQIPVGTFKLEDTEHAVTAGQAAQLLPLWQVYESLIESDTAAQEEIDALIQQIRETMTPEQMQAIDEMQLTPQDIFAVMQEQGLAQGEDMIIRSGAEADTENPEGGSFEFPGPGAGPVVVQGGPGGGPGGFPGGGQGLSPEQIATARAAGRDGRVDQVPSGLLTALIEMLKEKTGA